MGPRRTASVVLFALLAACSDQTHTIGQLGEEPLLTNGGSAARGPTAGATAGAAGVAPSTGVGMAATGQPSAGQAGDAIVTAGSAGSSAGGTTAAPTLTGCHWNVGEATRRPLDMYVLMDSNITVPLFGAWNVALVGLFNYVDDPRSWGTGVGLRYFGFDCDAAMYAEPDVPVRPLPANSTAIKSFVQIPVTVSSILPVLEGGHLHARSRANTFTDRKQIVVLATDGFADLACLSDEASVIAAAAAGLAGMPPIPTYVIGLGDGSLPPPFDMVARLQPLDEVAAAGGTGRARQVSSLTSPVAMTEALHEVQRDAEPCEYTPASFGDLAQTALGVAPPGVPAAPVERVAGPDECGDRDGFFFDDPDAPTSMVACPTTCQRIKASDAQVVTLTGCNTAISGVP